MEKRIDWWNLTFTLFYILLAYVSYLIVADAGVTLASISVWEFTLISLAIFRLTRLVVYDSITRWLRNWFDDGVPYTFTGTVKTLIHCPWCMSLWFALVVPGLYFMWPAAAFFIVILALGGMAALVQLSANLVGWNAEYKKRMTQSLEQHANEKHESTCG